MLRCDNASRLRLKPLSRCSISSKASLRNGAHENQRNPT
jgi:hypothetical protein